VGQVSLNGWGCVYFRSGVSANVIKCVKFAFVGERVSDFTSVRGPFRPIAIDLRTNPYDIAIALPCSMWCWVLFYSAQQRRSLVESVVLFFKLYIECNLSLVNNCCSANNLVTTKHSFTGGQQMATSVTWAVRQLTWRETSANWHRRTHWQR
jgi:hypothetical protein